MTIEERFLAKVARVAGCWNWTACLNNRGYGVFGVSDGEVINAHRWSYQNWIGPIPEGLEIDHLCRNKQCVNPAHLEAVTHLENMRRSPIAVQTHCKRGHSLDDAYPSKRSDGSFSRRCRQCHKALLKRKRNANH
jgi:hypothetical protein